jgi:diguanylate cyclase (GGDEF)-like protein
MRGPLEFRSIVALVLAVMVTGVVAMTGMAAGERSLSQIEQSSGLILAQVARLALDHMDLRACAAATLPHGPPAAAHRRTSPGGPVLQAPPDGVAAADPPSGPVPECGWPLSAPGLDIIAVSADGTVVLGPDTLVGTRAPAFTARSGGGGWTTLQWPDGRGYLAGFASRPAAPGTANAGVAVIARQPLDSARAAADAVCLEITLCGTALALLFSTLGWVAAGRITRPLRAIAAVADAIHNGPPGTEVPEVGGAAEIHSLSHSLRGISRALGDQHEAMAGMRDLAERDRLTGLANRQMLDGHIAALAEAGARNVALLYIDIDDFKPVNDTLGHLAGDEVLRVAAQRIASCLRAGDVAARLGGDEFMVVLTPECPADTARRVAQRIVDAVSSPVTVIGTRVRIGCSIGITYWPRHGQPFDQAMHAADLAMYQAKAAGKGRIAWFPAGIAEPQSNGPARPASVGRAG